MRWKDLRYRQGCGVPNVSDVGNVNAEVGQKVRSPVIDRAGKGKFALGSLKPLVPRPNPNKTHDKACENNQKRTWQCPSNHVLWNEMDPLWLPFLDVEDVLEVVYPQLCQKQFALSIMQIYPIGWFPSRSKRATATPSFKV